MSTILIDLQYLPTLEYFCCFKKAESIIIESHENYVKQSFRNRTIILTANGVIPLSVPVIGGNKKVRVSDIEIDYTQKWINNHWRAIQSAYGKAPYFEYYADYFYQIYNSEVATLFQLNKELLTLCLKLLQVEMPVKFSDEYQKLPRNGVIDLRSVIHPKIKFVKNMFYSPQPYVQLFGNEFVPNMSIIDLLFCEGPNASTIIMQSAINT